MDYLVYSSPDELMHHGVKGMHWGVRRYQNKDGTLTSAGIEHYRGLPEKKKNKLTKKAVKVLNRNSYDEAVNRYYRDKYNNRLNKANAETQRILLKKGYSDKEIKSRLNNPKNPLYKQREYYERVRRKYSDANEKIVDALKKIGSKKVYKMDGSVAITDKQKMALNSMFGGGGLTRSVIQSRVIVPRTLYFTRKEKRM